MRFLKLFLLFSMVGFSAVTRPSGCCEEYACESFSPSATPVCTTVCTPTYEPKTACKCTKNFYIKIGTGGSFSLKADVCAPTRIWDPAVEGYNSDLSKTGIVEAGVGYDFCDYFSGDVTVSFRPGFEYNKFQTGIPTDNVVNFLGNKTRRFKLDVSSVLFNGYLRGYGFDCLNWNIGCNGSSIYPIVGAGVGVSRFTIYDFISTGLPSVVAEGIPAFGSDYAYTARHEFTYQAAVGLEYLDCDGWALSAGYRWFAGKRFKGPSYIRRSSGLALDIHGFEWNQHLRANEVFVQLKLYF